MALLMSLTVTIHATIRILHHGAQRDSYNCARDAHAGSSLYRNGTKCATSDKRNINCLSILCRHLAITNNIISLCGQFFNTVRAKVVAYS